MCIRDRCGCYHLKWYLDGKLIAIAVVDILPECLSSVYYFYDPDYKFLNLGILSSLKEIEYIQELKKVFPQFKYYYLGFYIQNCQKMVYKGDYELSELLCPETCTWVPLTKEIRDQIDRWAVNKQIRLSKPEVKKISDIDTSNIENVMMWVIQNLSLIHI
eukprot:TRINITY_DN7097_c0_g1_i2.p1 TRINITY_DN7097_c0_g1~~TRINITY_DN7097_c0_g1_i2.p1  ORF type:complete len:160 (+),score=13.47 TRINITY_DN7097_c0_g1_i2:64-543(+)